MARTHEYQAKIEWTGAARGPTSSYEAYSREYTMAIPGRPTMRGSSDPSFRGDPALHNPEDLLLCALSACHMLSYLALAARRGLRVTAYADDARGTMELVHGGGRFVEVVLRPRVEIAAGGDAELARALHEKAHEACFIARSVNFPVRHEAEVRLEGESGTAR